jgi:hypothetical protein
VPYDVRVVGGWGRRGRAAACRPTMRLGAVVAGLPGLWGHRSASSRRGACAVAELGGKAWPVPELLVRLLHSPASLRPRAAAEAVGGRLAPVIEF